MQLARRFPPLSHDSIWRHSQHMPESLLAELRTKTNLPAEQLEKLRIEESSGLLENLVHQRAALYHLANSCEAVGDAGHAVAAHRAITCNLELTGKLLELFTAHTTTINNSLIISPDYLALRAALIGALAPHPAARQAVARVLRELEGPPEPAAELPAIEVEAEEDGNNEAGE